ncbi:DedA family protein [Weissella coleopterorum]|uniref:DedA family protein n=1 Tax=Weissella coleopterorum TaxID=2714949 RepID=A0A6G8AYF4_9LACO|nr:DedA family protein [Weissella coleopterorum]QIL50010.1 DedA family protein [Weissella coleopterorum]
MTNTLLEWFNQMMTVHGTLTWVEFSILFILILVETGAIFAGFIPGDTILITAGSIAGVHHNVLELGILILLFAVASWLGDAINYYFGAWLMRQASRIAYIDRHVNGPLFQNLMQHFNRKRWFLFVFAGRFVPFVRTLVPLTVHRLGLNFKTYLSLAAGASLVWSLVITSIGYFFGHLTLPHGLNWAILGLMLLGFGLMFSNKKFRQKVINLFIGLEA